MEFLRWIKFYSGCFRQVFFIWGTKKWSLVTLDGWSSYTVMNAWEFAWVDSALVVLDEWLSYGGSYLSSFDCRTKNCNQGISIPVHYLNKGPF